MGRKCDTILRGAAGLALAVLAGAFGGCSQPAVKPQPVAPPPRVVLDYRNGWYHKASGVETIEAVATHYQRDAKLVAELNNVGGGTYTVPATGTMLYIPPSNDRVKVREVLSRLQGHPELIPKTPWNPQGAKPAGAQIASATTASASANPVKVAAEPVKVKRQEAEPIKPKTVAQAKPGPANPLSGAVVRGTGAPELAPPPPPDRKEIVLAEGKPEKHSWFGWLGFGEKSKTPARPTSTPKPTPRPQIQADTAKPNTFIWPVKGEVVTTYKGGWHQACHGIEIAAAEGTAVHASRSGRVLLAQPYPGYGNLVLIDHGDGYATAYGYNRQMLVREGQQVSRGQTIASVGRPTQGSNSRLLFQVRRNAQPVDPLIYLKNS